MEQVQQIVSYKKGDSIRITHPNIFKQLHPTKNMGINENQLTRGSSLKVWWICNNNNKCGCHVWEAAIYTRTRIKSSGCPFCANKRKCIHDDIVISKCIQMSTYHQFTSFIPGNYNCVLEINIVLKSITGIFYSIEDIIKCHPFFEYNKILESINNPNKTSYNYSWVSYSYSLTISLDDYLKTKQVSTLLIDLFPDIYFEIDRTKTLIDTSNLSYASHTKIFFKCSKNQNHSSYECSILNRTLSNSGCRECQYDSLRVLDKIEKEEHIKNHVADLSRIVTGDEKEVYVEKIFQNLIKDGYFLDVEITGYTGEKCDVKVTLLNGIVKSLQIKTLIENIYEDSYHIHDIDYDMNMLIVMINNNYDRFVLEFAGNLNKSGTAFYFKNHNSAHEKSMYRDFNSFVLKLIELTPLSCDYLFISSSEIIKEKDMFERFKIFVEHRGCHFRRNNTNSNTVDFFVDNFSFQGKFCSLNQKDSLTYKIGCSKSCGSLNDHKISQPYSDEDPFDYMVIEIGGIAGDENKYFFNYLIMSKQNLIENNILKTKTCNGKMSIYIAPPDYNKDHWSNKYWYGNLSYNK